MASTSSIALATEDVSASASASASTTPPSPLPADYIAGERGATAAKLFCVDAPLAWIVVVALSLALAVLVMFLLRRCIEGRRYRKTNRIDGKVVIITGCNTGIGKETALEMARRGGRIYMACRDAVRCEAARLEIIEQTHNPNVYNRTLDLASLASVRRFAVQFLREEPRLDVLVNNAGIMATPRGLTVDGHEQQLGVNHLGHFLLTMLLLQRLKESAPSRIVVVSSAAHLFGRIRRNDLMSEKSYSKFFGAYAQSKLANILFARRLAKALANDASGVTVNSCHPGIVRTELLRYSDCAPWLQKMRQCVTRFLFKSPRAGAQTTLRLALDPSLEKSTGGYYSNCMPFPLPPWAKDKDTADWLWHESERLVQLNDVECAAATVTTTANTTTVTATATGTT